jgi:hypothetical protein
VLSRRRLAAPRHQRGWLHLPEPACVVEALCRQNPGVSRHWLLRHACDGDYLNGYFAGKLATAAHLSDAILQPDADDALIDHTGRLLRIMGDCQGMGLTLEHSPRQSPSSPRTPGTSPGRHRRLAGST